MSETIISISEAVKIVETFIQDMADDKLDTGDEEKLAKAEKQFAKLEHAMGIIKNRLYSDTPPLSKSIQKEKGPTKVSPFYTLLILGENQLLIV